MQKVMKEEDKRNEAGQAGEDGSRKKTLLFLNC